LLTGDVHVLPAGSPADGEADPGGAQGGDRREHVPAGAGRRHRLPAERRAAAGRPDEEEQAAGRGVRPHPPDRHRRHGVVPAVRVRRRPLAAEGHRAHDRLRPLQSRLLLALQGQGAHGRQRHAQVHHQVRGGKALRPVRSRSELCLEQNYNYALQI